MTNVRLIIGVFTGVILSVFSVGAFTMWGSFIEIQSYFGDNVLKAIYVLFVDNFRFDLITYIERGEFSIFSFLTPALLSWLFVGFVCGAIVKGYKRGFIIGILVVIVDILIWIVVGILAGEDVFNLFIDTNLFQTLGGILSAFMGAISGAIIGGAVSGPYEGI